MREYGVVYFSRKMSEIESTEEILVYNFFSKNQIHTRTIKKIMYESDNELWIRINKHINDLKLTIVNFQRLVGGNKTLAVYYYKERD